MNTCLKFYKLFDFEVLVLMRIIFIIMCLLCKEKYRYIPKSIYIIVYIFKEILFV